MKGKIKNITLKRKRTEITTSRCSQSVIICKKLKLSTLTDVANGSRSVNFNKLIIQFIVEITSPVSIVGYRSFKSVIEGAQQLTKPSGVMCRRTAKNKICDEYNEFKKKIR